MKSSLLKRVLSLTLCLLMVFTVLPLTSFESKAATYLPKQIKVC